MTRAERLLAWWRTARSTWQAGVAEAWIWRAFALIGVFVRALRESIPVLFFLSAYALSSGAAAKAQGARLEMKQEEAEEPT